VAWVLVRAEHVAFLMDKAALGQAFSEYFSFPANHHSTNFSIIILTRGWHNRLIGGCSAKWTQLDSTPHYTNLKKLIIFRIVFFEDSYLDIGQNLLLCTWSTRVPRPFCWSDPFHRHSTLRPWPHRGPSWVFTQLEHAYDPWLLHVPDFCLACPCVFQLPASRRFFFTFARCRLPAPEARCPRPSPLGGVIELLASCSGVSELLTS
jgi:hypothetical protein